MKLLDESGSGSRQITTLLRLRELLLNGEFTPGQRMAEIPLASRLQVSRTPLRLALTSLEHEGLLELHPTRGFVVRSFSLSKIYDSIEIRGLLEGMAGRLAVDRIRRGSSEAAEGLRAMTGVVDDLDHVVAKLHEAPAESLQQYIALNARFHSLLLETAQSEMLTQELGRVVRLPFAAPSSGFVRVQAEIFESREVLKTAQTQHHAILEAIGEFDGVRVEGLLREHARISRRNLQIVLQNASVHHMVPGLRLIREENTEVSSGKPRRRRTKTEHKPA